MSLVSAAMAAQAPASLTLGAASPTNKDGAEIGVPAFGCDLSALASSSDALFGVPKGCIVRNTFLEWDEEQACDTDSTGTPGRSSSPSSRRARSCPPEPEQVNRQSSWSDEEQELPLAVRTMSCITPRPRVFQVNAEDALADVQKPPPAQLSGADRQTAEASGPARRGRHAGGHCDDDEGSWLQESPAYQGQSPQMSAGGRSPASGNSFESRGSLRTPKGSASKRADWSSLVLRGLPFDATEADVIGFIQQYGLAGSLAPVQPVQLVTNPQGKPSGFAQVQLNKQANYIEMQERLHMQRLGDRYIEVLPPFSKAKTGSSWKSPSHRNSSRWTGGGSNRDSWRQM